MSQEGFYLIYSFHRGTYHIARPSVVRAIPGQPCEIGWADEEGRIICDVEDVKYAVALDDERLTAFIQSGET